MDFTEQALAKIRDGKKVNIGQKENAMKNAVAEALSEFCEQDEEFAQAVAQGGAFADCMNAVAKGVNNSISDLEAYKKAVKFYFSGAEIRVTMEIDTCPNRVQPEEQRRMIIDLSDFL